METSYVLLLNEGILTLRMVARSFRRVMRGLKRSCLLLELTSMLWGKLRGQ
jgi:hypothetical protein